ncbi:hypothetical protein [Paenarthrobacter sp. JL.01a]|uniref:hypothetical protein n=1 Tax=Paenarthrobacter sp. JL.01a TaxID=2979324 RepID=UPI0021CADB5C|nr:hypothetical protein [Paenarthrobacter sp. JL.01a]UXM91110.1 hypothetical protein N5P29_17705 [Paenarthrobacter sp. JL.01a]
MSTEHHIHKALLEDDLQAHVTQLYKLATDLGAALREESVEPLSSVLVPDISDKLEAAIRESLEDEIVPITEIQNGGIDDSEVDREVIKKALVSLKLATLRKIAKAEGTASSGSQEDVATRIAQRYSWDRVAVARLILANEDEPSIERGHISRVFPLVEDIDVNAARKRLSSVIGRYIRIGVARWFLFDNCRNLNESLEVQGTYKTYQASVEERSDAASLSATPHESSVRMLLGKSASLRIEGASAVPAKAAVNAFEVITGQNAKGYLPLADKKSQGIPGTLHPTSEYLLDLLENRLISSELHDINLTVARFNVRPGSDVHSTRTVDERRPELRAVRFEGQHLLDSVAACRLLTLESRPLVEIALHASIGGEEGTVGRFPVRITAEADHVAIQTGLGDSQHELSLRVHRLVVEACSDALTVKSLDTKRLNLLVSRMKERAESKEAPEIADIFSVKSEATTNVPTEE